MAKYCLDSVTNEERMPEQKQESDRIKRQLEALHQMRNLLTQEEKDALGEYQSAEEARKRELYG